MASPAEDKYNSFCQFGNKLHLLEYSLLNKAEKNQHYIFKDNIIKIV